MKVKFLIADVNSIFRILFLLILSTAANGQIKPFRIAFISDTHIGSPDGKAEEDLKRTVTDINNQPNIDFVVITGDITELGTDEQLNLAKLLLEGLRIKYYIIPGNHDDGWSESGGESFIRVFGNDKFVFDHNGIRFIGCASGPYVRMSDGHVPKSAINWMHNILDTTSISMPLIFLNHYPIDRQLDNWYEVIDMLKRRNTILIMCGHGHVNKFFSFEDIPGVMGRSNLRAKMPEGAYNIVDFSNDSIKFAERNPVRPESKTWTKIKMEDHHYDSSKAFSRPDYGINQKWPNVHTAWTISSDANVISTPCVIKDMVVFGNQNGTVEAVSKVDGKRRWTPAVHDDRIIFGNTTGLIYCLDHKGKFMWQFKARAAVLGSPLIQNNIVYIGGSDHSFRALQLADGKQLWEFTGMEGPVTGSSLIYNNQVIFGAWDTYLYSLNISDGTLAWKWSNGSPIRNYSPASCIPVVHDGVIYIVAPDRYLTAIDAKNGKTVWRTNESTVRESIGISEDGNFVYCKTMNDTIAAFHTSTVLQKAAWKLNVGYGYEHVPSMLLERNGILYFGTRNGVVYAIDITLRKINWAYKIDNSMVNTIRILDNNSLVAATMDGKVVLLTFTANSLQSHK